jgi:hypothetical protein
MNRHETMSFRRLSAALRLLALAGCLPALLAGCGDSKRQGIEGTVTFDGKPLEKGYVAFTPQPGTTSPTAGAEIKDGRFSIGAAEGVFVGKFRVEIIATRPSNKTVRNFRGVFPNVDEQFLPARYNSESELSVDVKSNGRNQVKFELTSH